MKTTFALLAAALLAPAASAAGTFRAIPAVPLSLPGVRTVVVPGFPVPRGAPGPALLPSPSRLPSLPAALPGVGIRGAVHFAAAAAPKPEAAAVIVIKGKTIAAPSLESLKGVEAKNAPMTITGLRVVFDGDRVKIGGRADTPESELEREIGVPR